jgi:hypothetical protein
MSSIYLELTYPAVIMPLEKYYFEGGKKYGWTRFIS